MTQILTEHPKPDPVPLDLILGFPKLSARPDPFQSTLTLEITAAQHQQIIVKLTGSNGTIAKLFGWYLLKGTNVTTLKDMEKLSTGQYSLSILSNEGEPIHQVSVSKN